MLIDLFYPFKVLNDLRQFVLYHYKILSLQDLENNSCIQPLWKSTILRLTEGILTIEVLSGHIMQNRWEAAWLWYITHQTQLLFKYKFLAMDYYFFLKENILHL